MAHSLLIVDVFWLHDKPKKMQRCIFEFAILLLYHKPFINTISFRKKTSYFGEALESVSQAAKHAYRKELVDMDRKNMDPKQVSQLLQAASKKLGVAPETLKTELESGKYDQVLKNMSQKDSAMLQKVLKNPKMMEKLISSPQAKALYQKLSGK